MLYLPHYGAFDILVCQITTIAPYKPKGGWWGCTLIGALILQILVFFLGNITRDSLTSVNECSIRGFDNGFLVIKVAQNSFHKVAQVLCNLSH